MTVTAVRRDPKRLSLTVEAEFEASVERSVSAGDVVEDPVGERRYSCEIGPLRYSINVTLDGCCDHRAIPADEDFAPARGREPQPGRRASLWPGDVRNDGICVAPAGADGSET